MSDSRPSAINPQSGLSSGAKRRRRPQTVFSDLALESAQTVKTGSRLPEGIELKNSEESGFCVTDVRVKSEEVSKRISKPQGRYITLEPRLPLYYSPSDSVAASRVIARYISELIGDISRVMVVGLGNQSVTADSLGPRVSRHIFATRHIPLNAPNLSYDGLKSVSCVTPGVMGDTGIEPLELLKPLKDAVLPDAVIIIDSLCCQSPSHLGRTIQLSDTGISPGSGVGNRRDELSRTSLGVRTVSVGVPTVASLGHEGGELWVTSKSIDKLISMSASLISLGINLGLHPGLDPEELRLLTS